jgi:lipopolysaccharide biosynthesis protein
VRVIAFYLPQFHPIPENDGWWGKGFTEWTNVTRAKPNFAGHYQPHLPSDLGFYDLRVPEVREQQAALADRFGIHGFCYYYYWFNGRQILERPLQEVFRSGKPDFPFCVCWANENWSRRWDGGSNEVLLQQEYSPEDDLAFIESLLPLFSDRRYIRVKDRPVLLVYRPDLLPDPRATAERWTLACREAGLPGVYLCAGHTKTTLDPVPIGFDAAFEFPPHGTRHASKAYRKFPGIRPEFKGLVLDYRALAVQYLGKPMPAYPLHKAVMVAWDNTARRQLDGTIFLHSSPEAYEVWLREAAELVRRHNAPGERLVFINAWNEWAEGAHLEPDQRFGLQYLEATRRALSTTHPERWFIDALSSA